MENETLLLSILIALLGERHELLAKLEQVERLHQHEVDYFRGEIKLNREMRSLTGESAGIRELRRAIGQVAPTDSTVLVLGETGTGKELVARAIHQISPRRQRLLVSVNCAALNPNIIASELFGHEPGAFTGASKRRLGRFELAHRGTLFLDEIGELTPDTQVMLLRVLQERSIERVGGSEAIPIDVRILAATHQDLERLVRDGKFRADLYFRLNVFPLRVPSLRDRKEDLPDLVRHFLHHFNRRMKKQVDRVDDSSLTLLRNYDWPGNVRELENIIERAMIVTPGNCLSIQPSWLPTSPRAVHGLNAVERQTIEEALKQAKGKIYGIDGAARALGLKPTTLYGKLRKLGIDFKRT